MKQFISFGAIAMAAILAGGLTSCQEEDFGLDSSVVKKTEYAKGFANEFGKPDANQRWDFYAMEMEQRAANAGVTRATAAEPSISYERFTPQLPFIEKANLAATCDETALPDQHNNSAKGSRDYTLTYNGEFTVSTLLYAGDYETSSNFEFGVSYSTYEQVGFIFPRTQEVKHRTRIFGSGEKGNPGYSANVSMTDITEFEFYIKADGKYYYSSDNRSILLADDSYTYIDEETNEEVTTYYRIIGFEDLWSGSDYDFNDCVFVISTTTREALPDPVAARYFCEDLYQLDWDFNDVVFDVSNTGVTLLAVGGTLPVYLSFDGGETKTEELHVLMGGEMIDNTYYKPINVGASNGIDNVLTQKIHTFETHLTNEEVYAFKPILYVGDEQFTLVNKDANAVVEFNPTADIPSIIQVSSDTKWMKEMINISKGYPTFYLGQDGKQWYEVNVQSQYLY